MGSCASTDARNISRHHPNQSMVHDGPKLQTVDDSVHVMMKHAAREQAKKRAEALHATEQQKLGYVPRQVHPLLEQKRLEQEQERRQGEDPTERTFVEDSSSTTQKQMVSKSKSPPSPSTSSSSSSLPLQSQDPRAE